MSHSHSIPRLFTPLKLRGLELANRILVSPMCQYAAVDGMPQPWHAMHLGGFAKSNPGMVIVEATGVEARGRISPTCLGLWNDAQQVAYARMIAGIHTYCSTPLGIQLGHAGRKASTQTPWLGARKSEPLSRDEGGWDIVGASPIPLDAGYPVPEALDSDGLATVRDAHANAARRADEAGFDLIELHGAHGYLLSSFLSPLSNQRTDRYGGSLENRMRFPLEVIRAVRDALSPAKPLCIRINGADWFPGSNAEEEAIVYARALVEAGVDLITVSAGGIAPGAAIPKLVPGYMLHLTQRIRAAVSVPIVGVGMIASPEFAEDVLASGTADLIAIGRGFLDDPNWTFHAADRLGARIQRPGAYRTVGPNAWPGYAIAHARP